MITTDLLDYVNENFDCHWGPPCAMMITPDGKTYPYVTYAVRSPTEHEACDWAVDSVFRPLAEATNYEGKLYWRLPNCMEYMTDDFGAYWRTRIIVTTKAGEIQTVPGVVVLEGTGIPRA